MLEWFTENSFFPATLGIFLAVGLIGMWFASGESSMLKLGCVVALLTVATIATEILIVTDREHVESALYDMADGMRQNDFDRVFAYLDNEELVRRARGRLRDATCHGCTITAVNEVSVSADGREAVADFVAFAKASNKDFPNPVPIQRRIQLDFRKSDSGDWKIVDFETQDPRERLGL